MLRVARRSSRRRRARSIRRAASARCAAMRRAVDRRHACAGRTSPSPSARRCCRPRPRNRPRPSSPPRSPATSRRCAGPARRAWLGLSSILTATSEWTTRRVGGELRDAREQRRDALSRRRRSGSGMSGRRSSAIAAAGTTTDGPMVAPHRVERYAYRSMTGVAPCEPTFQPIARRPAPAAPNGGGQ